MDIDTLEDLAKELKNDENNGVIALFEEYAKTHNIDEEKLEQILSKEQPLHRKKWRSLPFNFTEEIILKACF